MDREGTFTHVHAESRLALPQSELYVFVRIILPLIYTAVLGDCGEAPRALHYAESVS